MEPEWKDYTRTCRKKWKNEYNKTACIKAKPWMFQLPFKVYVVELALKNDEFI